MQLVLNADVAEDVVRGGWDIVRFAAADERPLNDLEALGWLVLSHNLGVITTVSNRGAAARRCKEIVMEPSNVAIAEQAQRAREYYEAAARAAQHWSSIIPRAIDAWEREQNRAAAQLKAGYTPYALVAIAPVACPRCGGSPWLLCAQTVGADLSLPVFYLCDNCGHVEQLGVGPVLRPKLVRAQPQAS